MIDEREKGAGREPAPKAVETYEPPMISWEEQIEVRASLALGCNKISGGGDYCNAASSS